MSSAQISLSRRPARRPKADAVLHGHCGGRRDAYRQLDASGLQGGQSLWLGGKFLNRQAFHVAKDGCSHCAANVAAESGEIAVDILSIPVIDALDRPAIEMMGRSDSSKCLPLRRTR
jgi:hypothetical protein